MRTKTYPLLYGIIGALLVCFAASPLAAQRDNNYYAYNPRYVPVKNGWALDSIIGFTGAGGTGNRAYYKHDAAGRLIEEQMYTPYLGVTGLVFNQFEFDDTGNETSITYNWDAGTSAWIPNSKIVDSYHHPINPNFPTGQAYYSWNGTGWVGMQKNETEYDNSGDQTLYTSYTWTENGWVPSMKSESVQGETVSSSWNQTTQSWEVYGKFRWTTTQNEPEGFVTEQGEQWTTENPVWTPMYRYYYQYDVDNNATRTIKTTYDSSLGWVVTSSQVATYDGPNRPTFLLDSATFLTGVLDAYSKKIMAYDANGNVTQEEAYVNQGGAWKGLKKALTTFDDNNKVISYEEYTWDDLQSTWSGSTKYKQTYNSDGLTDTLTYYSWPYYEPYEWTIRSRETHFYNSAKLDTLIKSEILDSSNEKWIPANLKGSVYDESFNRVTSYMKTWNTSSGKWIEMERDSARYDEYNNLVYEVNYEANNKYKLERKNFHYYYYSRLNTGLENIKEATNESLMRCWTEKGRLHLTNNQGDEFVRIYALDGRLVVDKRLNQEVASFELPQGVYLVTFGSERIKVLVP